jgi:hypothetical protein
LIDCYIPPDLANRAIGYWVNEKKYVNESNIHYDLMYNHRTLWTDTGIKTWIKKPNYKILLKSFTDPDDPVVLGISGSIDKNNNVELNPWYKLEEGNIDLGWDTTGEYLVKAYDNMDRILNETGFTPDFSMWTKPYGKIGIDEVFFAFRVEYLDELYRIDIVNASTNQVLASKTITPNFPEISITSPSQGSSVKPGIYEIKWDANDIDDDVLTYNIFMKTVEEETWCPVDIALMENNYIMDFTGFEKDDYSLKVVVTDGWNTAEDIVDFSIKRVRNKSMLINNPIWRVLNLFPFLRLLVQR